jgi:NADH-quinone oxidoreductase subunit J
MNWFQENWLFIASLALSALGVWWLMPTSWPRGKSIGVVLALAGCGSLARTLDVAGGPLTESILFWIFAAGALISAVLMITGRNPVYAALWFALATLSTSGLFLLQSAPFLAAATVIVYAGAIVVTFLFVMMLAQQSGATIYDQRARQPLAATIAAFLLLGTLLYTLQGWTKQVEDGRAMNAAAATANPLSRPAADEPIDTMHALGRSLFGDHLFAVELAGTVLLIAAIGAIAMAPRRAEGKI